MAVAKRPRPKVSGKLLQYELLDEAKDVLAQAKTKKVGVAARTLAKEGPFRITIIGMARGAVMKRHHVDGPISLHVLRGRIGLETDEQVVQLGPGDLTVLDDAVQHDVVAAADSVFLITMSWHRTR
jgi:quercetin dioxygenase-like cupin family protein